MRPRCGRLVVGEVSGVEEGRRNDLAIGLADHAGDGRQISRSGRRLTPLVDALTEQQKRENTEYATRLTEAIHAQLAALELTVPLSINITLAPETWLTRTSTSTRTVDVLQ